MNSTAELQEQGWRRPVIFLMLMAVANGISFATWMALVNNFAIEKVSFTGYEIGILQSIREIPGFLAFTAVFVLLVMREQTLALVALALLGIGTGLTGYFPMEYAFYGTTLLMSVGFHYYETMNQSLALQWFSKADAPRYLGRIIAAGSLATISAYALIFVTWKWLQLDYVYVYTLGGAITVAITLVLAASFPQFKQHTAQRKQLILRKRYWLYYALTFMSGARRQIFIVFAGFLMVEKFGYSVAAITALFLVNAIFNMIFAPKIGALIGRFGERKALIFEYIGLILVFVWYAFVDNPWIAAGLYIVDHAFFALAIAMKTYFQKIADPADIASTAGVAFTISHIVAVVLPFILGVVWIANPSAVFLLGAVMAAISLVLSTFIPNNPAPGREVAWRRKAVVAAPAE